MKRNDGKKKTMTTVTKVIRRAGFEVPGDLLLIGDVNPDGTVRAGGNIYIMVQLKGIAHAGYKGNNEAIIAASVMKPAQLRIAGQVNLSPDQYTKWGHDLECAFMDEEENIIIEKLQVLKKYRPNLNRLEGGL
jgi:septum site-determining protein MinC